MLTLTLDDPKIPEHIREPRREEIDRAIKVIEAEDQLVHGATVCLRAGHCALGALLFAAGMSNVELIRLPAEPGDFTQEQADLLYHFYRIGQDDAYAIMSANDHVKGSSAPYAVDATPADPRYVVVEKHGALRRKEENELLEEFRAIFGEDVTMHDLMMCSVRARLTPEELEQRKQFVIRTIESTMSQPGVRSWPKRSSDEDEDYEGYD